VSLEEMIESNVEITLCEQAAAIDERVRSERYEDEYLEEDGSEQPIITKTAVLKGVDGFDLAVTNAAVDAMAHMLAPSSGGANDSPVPIRRAADPVTEWNQNGDMIAAAFPQLFTRGGECLPTGTWSPALINHLMKYYDGRFEQNTGPIATLFNQLQRHTAVRKGARIGSSRATVLAKLGRLANSEQFRSVLERAQQNPESAEARRVNAYLLRLLSLVGGSVPF